MKNADLPAMPSEIEARVAQDNLGVNLNDGYEWHKASSGLTKRELMAMHMMAANRSRNSDYASWGDMAKDALEMTDALLEKLEQAK